jgi:hypothetical protein
MFVNALEHHPLRMVFRRSHVVAQRRPLELRAGPTLIVHTAMPTALFVARELGEAVYAIEVARKVDDQWRIVQIRLPLERLGESLDR